MAYTRQTWTSGDVITAEKLNHIEEGINNSGSSALVINATESGDVTTLDKTWQEIYNAFPNCYIVGSQGKDLVGFVGMHDSQYGVFAGSFQSYTCASANDYPAHTESSGGDISE